MSLSPQQIHPLGVGTFGLGADPTENTPSQSRIDQNQHLETTLYRISLGHNFFETSHHYANGQTMQFLSKVFEQVDREKIYITTKINYYVDSARDIIKHLDQSLQAMGLEYVDGIGFSASAIAHLPVETAYEFLQKVVQTGKAKSLHGSNLNLPRLEKLKKTELLPISHEGLYNLECKQNETNGVIDFCKRNNIIFLAYQPLRRNRTAKRNYPELVALSQKYHLTQNQILLSWLINHKNLHVMDKSTSQAHIDENHQALGITLEDADYQILNNFQRQEFNTIPIDWENRGGIPINKLPNQLP